MTYFGVLIASVFFQKFDHEITRILRKIPFTPPPHTLTPGFPFRRDHQPELHPRVLGEIEMLATDVAGQIPASNWNNATTANANAETVGIILNDETGTATTATATWQSGSASWSVVHTGAGTAGDLAMMTGYLDQGGDGLGQIHSVVVTDIPYGNYDVYLYHSSNGGPNRSARYQADGIDLFTRNLDPAGVFDDFVQAGYGSSR